MDCIFCKIVNKEIPADIVYEDDDVIAFKDTNPQAPVHVLLVPKVHISSLNNINGNNSHVISKIFEVIPLITEKLGINKSGYRVISNCGSDGQQTVEHIHYHVMGGRNLQCILG